MSLYSEYDKFHPIYTRQSCSKGGKTRTATGQRDRWGRMLPYQGELPTPKCHGRAGGIKRNETGKRINGRYIKD